MDDQAARAGSQGAASIAGDQVTPWLQEQSEPTSTLAINVRPIVFQHSSDHIGGAGNTSMNKADTGQTRTCTKDAPQGPSRQQRSPEVERFPSGSSSGVNEMGRGGVDP